MSAHKSENTALSNSCEKGPDPVRDYWNHFSTFKSMGSFDSIGEASGVGFSGLFMENSRNIEDYKSISATSSLKVATRTKIPERKPWRSRTNPRIYRASKPVVDQSLPTKGPLLNNIGSGEKDGNGGTIVFEDSRDETIVKDDEDDESKGGPQPGCSFVCGDFDFSSLSKLFRFKN